MGLQAASLIARSAVIADHIAATILGTIIGAPIGVGLAMATPIPWFLTAGAFIILANLLYFIILEGRTGTTPAKDHMDLSVVDQETLEPISPRAAITRNFVRILDFSTLYLTGIGTAFASPLSQRLGDRAARTVVVIQTDGETDVLKKEQPTIQQRFIGWLLAVIGVLPFIGFVLAVL